MSAADDKAWTGFGPQQDKTPVIKMVLTATDMLLQNDE